MSEYTVLPLLNSAFEPGKAREAVERFEDVDIRRIAQAELFYFTGQAEECCEITREYLSSKVIELRLSACMVYGYSNLTLGNAAARRGLEGIQVCVKMAMKSKVSDEAFASCAFCGVCGRGAFASSYGGDSLFVGVQWWSAGGVEAFCGLYGGASGLS